MRDYKKAREYLQNVRMLFDKTMAPEMKEALETAVDALLECDINRRNITYISPLDIERMKNDT